LPHALDALVGVRCASIGMAAPLIVHGEGEKAIVIDTLLPARAERFAWGGHMGLRMLPQVVQALEAGGSTLVFTNVRSQAD
jgi:ATP-dependent Lhr-like helicase